MEDDALDLLADLEEVNQFHGQAEIEFFYESGDMSCPIEGCNQEVKYVSKWKWQRHWEERHVRQAVKYLCSVASCKAECRRRSDMRAHIKAKHERDPDRAEDVLIKCEKQVRENRGFIDPGFFMYKGRTLYRNIDQAGPIQEEQAGPSNQEEQAGPSNQEERAGPCNPQEQAGPCNLQEQAGSSNPQEQAGPCMENEAGTDAQEPMEVLHALSTASTNEGETQTCCQDYPQLYIPVCPDTIEGAESHIMLLCNVMDQVGRACEGAGQEEDRGNEAAGKTIRRRKEKASGIGAGE
ncbi:hypothetical protein FSP39_005924 [Pinctada imbricata]|uniref:C2H2-type domain-containing protein n=1 Tax=Pinctada imbricata TaxID=66713 RepID=A0AA88XZ06_PINIB|nr:hypothetical protein FSP39_005924 [Pinctada imbricata]